MSRKQVRRGGGSPRRPRMPKLSKPHREATIPQLRAHLDRLKDLQSDLLSRPNVSGAYDALIGNVSDEIARTNDAISIRRPSDDRPRDDSTTLGRAMKDAKIRRKT